VDTARALPPTVSTIVLDADEFWGDALPSSRTVRKNIMGRRVRKVCHVKVGVSSFEFFTFNAGGGANSKSPSFPHSSKRSRGRMHLPFVVPGTSVRQGKSVMHPLSSESG
jgi:hypothetical protein